MPSTRGDIARLGELGAARCRPWPRVFTNVGSYMGGGVVGVGFGGIGGGGWVCVCVGRYFCDFSIRGRIRYRRRPIPPRDRNPAIIPAELWRRLRRRAVGAGGLSPAQAARNRERLSLHPFRAGGGPRAHLALRRILLPMCVFPHPDSRRPSARCPLTDFLPLRPMSISARCMYMYSCTYSARGRTRSYGPAPTAVRIN